MVSEMDDFDKEAYDRVCKETAAEIESLMKRVVLCKRASTMSEDVQNQLDSLGVTEVITYEDIRRSEENPDVPKTAYIAIEVKAGEIHWIAECRGAIPDINPEDISTWDIIDKLDIVQHDLEEEAVDWKDDIISLGMRIFDGNKVIGNDGQMRPLAEVLR